MASRQKEKTDVYDLIVDGAVTGKLRRKIERMLAIWQSVEHWLENYEIAVDPCSTPDDLKLGGKYCALCHYDSNHYDSNRNNPAGSKPPYPPRSSPFPTAPPQTPKFVTCNYCPIYRYTGSTECEDTPYTNITRIMEDFRDSLGSGGNENIRRFLVDQVAFEYSFLIDVAFAEIELLCKHSADMDASEKAETRKEQQ